MDLPQSFALKAQSELHETENVKRQCLEDFRQWIARHDYFVDCRKGARNSPDDSRPSHVANFLYF